MSEISPTGLSHRLLRMQGRNPDESHRASTPLELLFDLAFVVAFAQAGDQLSHLVAAGHVVAGLNAFAFAMFAVCWAWINFSWFASAYDTDDWFYRVTTMVQMIGVVILALGLPAMFASVEHGVTLDNGVMVAGYVVMRVAVVAQWLRAAAQDPERRSVALTYVVFVTAAQIGWVLLVFAHLPLWALLILSPLLFVFELGVPVIAESRGRGTPWNANHIAERYGLLTIIALGEVLSGTVSSVTALVERQGWSVDAVLVVVAGVGLTFGLWWSYFIMPSAAVLRRHRRRAFAWGYGHIIVFASIAATGAGLHVVADVSEGGARIGMLGAALSVAIPVLAFVVVLFLLYSYLVREKDPLHILLFVGTVVMLVVAVLVAAAGWPIGVTLVLITLSPVVIIVGYETLGHRHAAAALARLRAHG